MALLLLRDLRVAVVTEWALVFNKLYYFAGTHFCALPKCKTGWKDSSDDVDIQGVIGILHNPSSGRLLAVPDAQLWFNRSSKTCFVLWGRMGQ